MIKKNIVYLENGKASLIRYRGGNFEFIKKDGEIEFPIEENFDFWSWWKNAVSYLENQDEADICFIYDKEYDLLYDTFFNDINQVSEQNSFWNLKNIQKFFEDFKQIDAKICLLDKNGTEYFFGESLFRTISVKRFYTNLSFSKNKFQKHDKNSEQKQSEENDFSDIAKYFVDLIKKERK